MAEKNEAEYRGKHSRQETSGHGIAAWGAARARVPGQGLARTWPLQPVCAQLLFSGVPSEGGHGQEKDEEGSAHVYVCVCSRWERADKCALAAHPNNVIICIFIQIVACYIMILYTVEYLT